MDVLLCFWFLKPLFPQLAKGMEEEWAASRVVTGVVAVSLWCIRFCFSLLSIFSSCSLFPPPGLVRFDAEERPTMEEVLFQLQQLQRGEESDSRWPWLEAEDPVGTVEEVLAAEYQRQDRRIEERRGQ